MLCIILLITHVGLQMQPTSGIKHPRHLIPWLLPLFPAITNYVIYGLSSAYSNVIMGLLPHEIIWVFYTSLVDTHVYRNMVLHAGDYTHLSTNNIVLVHIWHVVHAGDEQNNLSILPDSQASS